MQTNALNAITLQKRYAVYDAQHAADGFTQNGLRHFRLNAGTSGVAQNDGDPIFGIVNEQIHEVGIIRNSDQSPTFFHSVYGHLPLIWGDVTRLETPIKVPKEVIDALPESLAFSAGIIGEDRQWLHPVPNRFGKSLHALISGQLGLDVLEAALKDDDRIDLFLARHALHEALARAGTPVDQIALCDAYHQRGAFLDAVKLRNPTCPFTGLTENLVPIRLKPWHWSSDAEKLDPDNALMVAEGIAQDIEDGLLTMDAANRVKYVQSVLDSYFADKDLYAFGQVSPAQFSTGQQRYLDCHRRQVFRDGPMTTRLS